MRNLKKLIQQTNEDVINNIQKGGRDVILIRFVAWKG